jgi:hypothetical protein
MYLVPPMRVQKCLIICLIVPAIIFLSNNDQDGVYREAQNRMYGECESCHSGFEAFTLTPDAPSEVPMNYSFEYKIIVRNTWKHTVKELEATLDLSDAPYIMFPGVEREPYLDELEDEVFVLTANAHTFPVEENAVEAIINLDGDEGMFGWNNIDLSVRGPSGAAWTSEGEGADESIVLDSGQLAEGGTGEYIAEVYHVRGRGSIAYTLTIEVYYGGPLQLVSHKKGEDLGPGEEYIFTWDLLSKAKGDNEIKVSVSGIAYYNHANPTIPDSDKYTYSETSSIKVGEKLIYAPPVTELTRMEKLWLIGRVTGFIAFGLLCASMVTGCTREPIRSIMNKLFRGARRRIIFHCGISFGIIVVALIHGTALYLGPYAGTHKGLFSGTVLIVGLCAIGATGVYQKRITRNLGYRKWRQLHFWLAVIIFIIGCAHAVILGTDLAFLRFWE